MKTLYLFFAGLLAATVTVAQPTLPASKFFVPGVTETYSDADSTGVLVGPSGANQTWNFSSVVDLGSTSVTQYMNAAGTPYASSFPSANIALTSPGTGFYQYINHQSAYIDFLGYQTYDSANSVNLMYTYSDPLRYSTFPVTYNTTTNDTYAASSTMSVSGITLNIYDSGTSTAVADAWGTVITPAGTYSNCLRIKTTRISRDSMVYVGIPIPPVVTVSHSVSYSWVEGNGAVGASRMQISIDSTFDDTGALQSSDKTVQYLSSLVTGIDHVTVEESPLNVYPNPAAEYITLSSDDFNTGMSVVNIYNLRGQKVYSSELSTAPGTELSIPVDKLMSGVYTVSVTGGNKIYKGQFIRL